MPYKDPERQRQAQIIIQRRYRKRQKLKLQKLSSVLRVKQPDLWKEIFGKPQKRRAKR